MAAFEVRVTSVPKDKTRAVRALRVIGRLHLSKAEALYGFLAETSEAVVAAGLDGHVAEHVCRVLQEGGIEAELGPSSAAVPMVLDPAANAIYEWGPLRTLRRASSG